MRTPKTIVENSQQRFADISVCGLAVMLAGQAGARAVQTARWNVGTDRCRRASSVEPTMFQITPNTAVRYAWVSVVGQYSSPCSWSPHMPRCGGFVRTNILMHAVVAPATLRLRAYSWERVGLIGFWWLGHGHRTYRNSNGVSGRVKLDNQQAKRCNTLGALGHGRRHVQ